MLVLRGFEPQTSGVGSDHSANWATTTSIADFTSLTFCFVSWCDLFDPKIPYRDLVSVLRELLARVSYIKVKTTSSQPERSFNWCLRPQNCSAKLLKETNIRFCFNNQISLGSVTSSNFQNLVYSSLGTTRCTLLLNFRRANYKSIRHQHRMRCPVSYGDRKWLQCQNCAC